MAIINGSILNGGTTSTTGGTAVTLTAAGPSNSGTLVVSDTSVADYVTRPTVVFTTKNPVLQSDQTYGKGRKTATIKMPKVHAVTGKVRFPLIRIEFEDVPDMTVAEQTKLLNWAAQLLSDSDFTSFLAKRCPSINSD